MWDLETIIRMNNEKRQAPQKDTIKKGEQEEAEGDEGILDSKERVFGKVTYVRSVYEGKNK